MKEMLVLVALGAGFFCGYMVDALRHPYSAQFNVFTPPASIGNCRFVGISLDGKDGRWEINYVKKGDTIEIGGEK